MKANVKDKHVFVVHPGETIADLLKERHMSPAQLSEITGADPEYIRAVLDGKKDITKDFSKELEKAFGVPISFWRNLQKNYNRDMQAEDFER